MNYKIDHVEALSVGAKAVSVPVRGLSFLAKNRSESAVVYFKEKREDGRDVTAADGYPLGPGEETPLPLAARELSLIAGAAAADVRLLILDTE